MQNLLASIDAALDRNDTAAAAAFAKTALEQGSRDPIVYNLVAWQCEEDGRFAEAEALIRQAMAIAPNDPTLYVGLGVVLRKQGQLKDAVAAFERAIEIDPGYGSAWHERGATFERGGAIAHAADDYRHALKLEPGEPLHMAALASVCARRGELAEAKDLAEAALQRLPDSVSARHALAQVAMEEKRFDDAVTLLEGGSPFDPEKVESEVGRLALLGDAYEGVGRYRDAYRAYARSQDIFQALNANQLAESPTEMLETLEHAAAAFVTADKTAWASPRTATDPAGPRSHVFLTGHPRSGTTLAENILASLPGAQAIEERRTLAGVPGHYRAAEGGFAQFAALPEAEIDLYRADYWQRAREAVGADLAGALFIDMDPFKGLRLPVIARMFPGAKYVITRRDPRDVVWSCFHTNFAFNLGTAMLSTLDHVARHYAANWTIIEESLATLSLDWFELRYEALVSDFDSTTQALCRFLGEEWSDELRQFDRTAQRRGVSTASVAQVRKGLYDGSGGWKRYAEEMASVEPILAPWIERFGYQPS